jgi:hypothetical protein
VVRRSYEEPVSGFEPLACRLQEVRPHATCALPGQMTRIIALMALTTLGLSGAPVHEPVHAEASCPVNLCVTPLRATLLCPGCVS